MSRRGVGWRGGRRQALEGGENKPLQSAPRGAARDLSGRAGAVTSESSGTPAVITPPSRSSGGENAGDGALPGAAARACRIAVERPGAVEQCQRFTNALPALR
ncbi:hypothetical protein AAFF_G00113440 [Aldrovandia affinis]|uniref:Uncharacterized protein n=1 Tax=Aldrovandia affinis TaxID=143900 RepID=A0AAD7RTH1_9TELE|nr:hypothetical protein AAFF_G00113440 [Aldrovandia affinis]